MEQQFEILARPDVCFTTPAQNDCTAASCLSHLVVTSAMYSDGLPSLVSGLPVLFCISYYRVTPGKLTAVATNSSLSLSVLKFHPRLRKTSDRSTEDIRTKHPAVLATQLHKTLVHVSIRQPDLVSRLKPEQRLVPCSGSPTTRGKGCIHCCISHISRKVYICRNKKSYYYYWQLLQCRKASPHRVLNRLAYYHRLIDHAVHRPGCGQTHLSACVDCQGRAG